MARRLFLSYAHGTRQQVEVLAGDLRRAGYDPFFDEQLTGGQSWWSALLDELEHCEVFVPVLSKAYNMSAPCQREAEYAQDLGKPFLPIMIEKDMDPAECPPKIAEMHCLSYDHEDVSSVLDLTRALVKCSECPPLPHPMPTRPPIPMSYAGRTIQAVITRIQSPHDLTRQEQFALLGDLKALAATSEVSAPTVHQLLIAFSDRPDITRQIADEVLALMDTVHGDPFDESSASASPLSTRVTPRRPSIDGQTADFVVTGYRDVESATSGDSSSNAPSQHSQVDMSTVERAPSAPDAIGDVQGPEVSRDVPKRTGRSRRSRVAVVVAIIAVAAAAAGVVAIKSKSDSPSNIAISKTETVLRNDGAVAIARTWLLTRDARTLVARVTFKNTKNKDVSFTDYEPTPLGSLQQITFKPKLDPTRTAGPGLVHQVITLRAHGQTVFGYTAKLKTDRRTSAKAEYTDLRKEFDRALAKAMPTPADLLTAGLGPGYGGTETDSITEVMLNSVPWDSAALEQPSDSPVSTRVLFGNAGCTAPSAGCQVRLELVGISAGPLTDSGGVLHAALGDHTQDTACRSGSGATSHDVTHFARWELRITGAKLTWNGWTASELPGSWDYTVTSQLPQNCDAQRPDIQGTLEVAYAATASMTPS